MKKKKTKLKAIPRYEFGTLIESPSTALAENNIALARAAQKAGNNGWVKGLKIFGNLAQQVGTSMMNKGAAEGQGADGKGIAGFLNENNGTMNSLLGGMSAVGNTGGFAFGGEVPNMKVEVEGQEVGQTPDGQVLDFQGPAHEDGGIPIALPAGTEMYSKRIKVDGVSMADRKKKREKKTVSLEQLLSKNTKDPLLHNALGRTMATNEIEETADNKVQETVKSILQPTENMHAFGNMVGGEDPTNPYGIKFAKGFDYSMFEPYLNKYSSQTNPGTPPMWNSQDIKTIQQYVGTNPDGVLGKDSLAKMQAKFNTNPLNGTGQGTGTGTNPNIDYAGIEKMFANMPISDDARLGEVTNRPYSATPGIVADRKGGAGKPGVNKTGKFSLDDITGGATFGDVLGMAGNIYQADKTMDMIKQNRAGDTPNINAFENYGQEGLKTLDKTKGYINQVRDEVLKDLELSRTGNSKRNRNSARGVNTLRALDLATDAQTNQAQEQTYSTFAEQMMGILSNEAGMKNQMDRVVMEGNQAKDLADRKDRDNYFTQLITGHQNIGKTMSATGGDLNKIKERKVMQNLINQLSMYGITVDESGTLQNKKTK